VPCVISCNFVAAFPSWAPISLTRPLRIQVFVSFHKCQFARISHFTSINYETTQNRWTFRFKAFACVWWKELVHPWNKWSMIFAVNPACCRYWAFTQPLSVGQSLTMSTALHNLIFHRGLLQYVLLVEEGHWRVGSRKGRISDRSEHCSWSVTCNGEHENPCDAAFNIVMKLIVRSSCLSVCFFSKAYLLKCLLHGAESFLRSLPVLS